VGFQVINKFLAEIAPYGHPDFQPKLIGRGINVMISPLPRNKRARHPNLSEGAEAANSESKSAPEEKAEVNDHPVPTQAQPVIS
jgi:translation initiation factor IF-3